MEVVKKTNEVKQPETFTCGVESDYEVYPGFEDMQEQEANCRYELEVRFPGNKILGLHTYIKKVSKFNEEKKTKDIWRISAEITFLKDGV